MAALLAGMNDCAGSGIEMEEKSQSVWSRCITSAIENLVSRNVEAWTYCQHVSGINGLYTLILLGNNTIKKLAVSTMLDHTADEATNQSYIDELVAKNAIDIFRRLLCVQGDDDLILITTRLVKIVVLLSKRFRWQAFSSEQKEFFSIFPKLLTKNHPEIQTVVCEIIDYFCVEDHDAVRSELMRYDSLRVLVSIASAPAVSGTNEGVLACIGKQDLVNAAAKTIANLTVSDESEFLDGSAPLRPTLASSGILPIIKSKRIDN